MLGCSERAAGDPPQGWGTARLGVGRGMSADVGTGNKCAPRRAPGECVRVWVCLSSIREALRLLVYGLVLCTLLHGSSWRSLFGVGWGMGSRSRRGQLLGVDRALFSLLEAAAAQLLAPGTCQRMLLSRLWPRAWAGMQACSPPLGLAPRGGGAPRT